MDEVYGRNEISKDVESQREVEWRAVLDDHGQEAARIVRKWKHCLLVVSRTVCENSNERKFYDDEELLN